MARRHKQIFPCFSVGSLLQILGSSCLVWTFRASDTAVPHRGSQAETPSRSAVCVQSTSSQHESSVEGMEVLSTLLAGLSDTRLSADSAQALRSWHAFKVCSVLNTPVHLTRISTSDLFRLHQIQDPVQLVLARMQKRLRKLLRRADTHADVTTSAQVIQVLRDKIQFTEALPRTASDREQGKRSCQRMCRKTFASAQLSQLLLRTEEIAVFALELGSCHGFPGMQLLEGFVG